VAEINVAGLAHGEGHLPFIQMMKRGYHVLEVRASLAHRLQYRRNLYVRPDVNSGWRIFRPDIGEQKQHEQGAASRPQIYPPFAPNIKAPIYVPSGIAGIAQAWKANHE
jgi:hypothetical protein